jgi:hypothetical protein
MALITEEPQDLPTSNALDWIDLEDDTAPAAYLRFGSSPCALDDPPEVGDIRIYVVRTRCTEEHGPIERKDGEMRYARTLAIQACWLEGDTEPPAADEEQADLFSNADE